MPQTISRLNTVEAAKYVKENHGLIVSPKTLETKRSRGGGPNYERFGGRVLYRPAFLDAWVNDSTEIYTHTA